MILTFLITQFEAPHTITEGVRSAMVDQQKTSEGRHPPMLIVLGWRNWSLKPNERRTWRVLTKNNMERMHNDVYCRKSLVACLPSVKTNSKVAGICKFVLLKRARILILWYFTSSYLFIYNNFSSAIFIHITTIHTT